MLLEQLVPPIAFYRQIKGFITEDLPALWDGLYRPRNLLSDPLGFLHDIWTMLLHFVTDFVLALVRRIINMAMSLMFWVTVILTVIGAFFRWRSGWNFWRHSGCFGRLWNRGGTGWRGRCGGGRNCRRGSWFRCSTAYRRGPLLRISHHSCSHDWLYFFYNSIPRYKLMMRRSEITNNWRRVLLQLALDSFCCSWHGLPVVIADAVAGLLRKIELPPAFSRFLRGIGSTRKPTPGRPAVDPAALAVEQELAGKIGGELARYPVKILKMRAAVLSSLVVPQQRQRSHRQAMPRTAEGVQRQLQ